VNQVSIVGIDPSGPASPKATGIAVFRFEQRKLALTETDCNGSDREILNLVAGLSSFGPVVVGLDAPLSYEAGGSLRARDRSLQQAIQGIGMLSRHVMAPLAPRMAILTLRGVALSRLLSSSGNNNILLVEVHPSACLGLRGASLADVTTFKTQQGSRVNLIAWLGNQGLGGIQPTPDCSDHFVAACAAALAAWKWYQGDSAWRVSAEPPWHPYDFTC